ncbi:MAG: TonB-dependent receptor [Pseudomonadota bacterium]
MGKNNQGVAWPGTSLFAALLCLALQQPASAESSRTDQLADLGLEQLLGLEVYAASRFPQPLAEAPSAITVITAEDIHQFGYRTLSDVLRSIPGLHTSDDQMYDYLGVRGIRRAGDFNSPVLLLIDGQRQNDNVYEAAAIGHDLPVPVELIERVEFVRGPGSSVFGSNALFGTINVVTRTPSPTPAFRATTEVGTAGLGRGFLQFDTPLGAQTVLQLSATYGHRLGEDFRVQTASGPVRFDDIDDEEYQHFTAKLVSGAWTLQGLHGARIKQSPLPIYGADPGSPDTRYRDSNGFIRLGYESTLGKDWLVQGQLSHSHYEFLGDLIYDDVIDREISSGRWVSGELSAVYSGFENHRLLLGVDGQNDYRQRELNYDVDPFVSHVDTRRRGSHIGIYVQDDWRLGPRLSINAGVRQDFYSDFSARLTPRLALIGKPTATQVVKLIYGKAYRVPSNYERYYYSEDGEDSGLKPEVAYNIDLIWENRLSDTLRMQVAAQSLHLHDYIVPPPGEEQFSNEPVVNAQGLDLVVDKHWPGSIRSRGSFSLQRTENRGRELDDAPRWLAKFQGSLPVAAVCRLGLEALGTGQRDAASSSSSSFWLLNLTASGIRLRPGLELSFSIDNLLDKHYTNPASPDLSAVGIDTVPGDGRQFRLRLGLEL